MKKLIIDRKRWIRGSLTEPLADHIDGAEGYGHCAMGFYAEALGIPDAETDGHGSLDEILKSSEDLTKCQRAALRKFSPDVQERIALANDDMFGEDRENELKGIFAELGIKVEFTGDYYE